MRLQHRLCSCSVQAERPLLQRMQPTLDIRMSSRHKPCPVLVTISLLHLSNARDAASLRDGRAPLVSEAPSILVHDAALT